MRKGRASSGDTVWTGGAEQISRWEALQQMNLEDDKCINREGHLCSRLITSLLTY